MGPLLEWAASTDGPQNNGASETPPHDEADPDDDTSDDDSDSAGGVIISTVKGKLAIDQRAHLLYLHRCDRHDTTHPLHGMSYLVWHRLVRVERTHPSDPKSTRLTLLTRTTTTAGHQAATSRSLSVLSRVNGASVFLVVMTASANFTTNGYR